MSDGAMNEVEKLEKEKFANNTNLANRGESLMETGQSWSVQKSRELYGIPSWGNGYFNINEKGNVCVTPKGPGGPKLDMLELTKDLKERGIRTPILIRFPDIVDARIDLINQCFRKAIGEYGYKGQYRGVYPIKVNQQKHLVTEILAAGNQYSMGLECGSKPELLVALPMVDNPNALIICNGFKDSEYIETALIAQKLEKNVLVVIDRYHELPLIITISKRLGIKPRLGFRVKLWSKGSGKWVESSGNRSKFGLTPSEIVEGFDLLKRVGLENSLELLHFHIGSQITSIHAIKTSLREAARMYTEITRLGANLKFIDVGGGLGVDYDGSGHSDSSINYSEQEYANDVVSVIQELCDAQEVPHPDIISESGRALVAHQSVLIFDILGCNEMSREVFIDEIMKSDHATLQNLYYIYKNVNENNFNESYNDLVNLREDVNQLFNYGVLNLRQMAKAENLIWATITKMEKVARLCKDCDDITFELKKQLSDTYFGNFSVFQSLPDSWAVGQIFPVMPIHRLAEKPEREATLADLTCDSDGKIEKFIDITTGQPSSTLQVHNLAPGENYYFGVFLVGAYQEILGDLHNLFGDTDAVHIKIHENDYTVDHVVEGDSVGEVLSYLEYNKAELIDGVRRLSEKGILKGTLQRSEARLLMKYYEDGLNGYTYLEEAEI